jgi:hypothetical protein
MKHPLLKLSVDFLGGKLGWPIVKMGQAARWFWWRQGFVH